MVKHNSRFTHRLHPRGLELSISIVYIHINIPQNEQACKTTFVQSIQRPEPGIFPDMSLLHSNPQAGSHLKSKNLAWNLQALVYEGHKQNTEISRLFDVL
jgi:hypothetical protein